jgi:ADP-ribosylglycohydrolase
MNMNNYREKVLGCWLGKAVGGTLGQPYEGCNGPLDLSYYNPVPEGMIPNDDLDLQVLWACVLDGMAEPLIDRDVFSAAWLKNVNFPWDEYGIAIRNLRNGIKAPHSGSYGNWFKDGLGAAIRSELWACLAPGNPKLAAEFAYEDACVDHVGDGIYAEQFLSALESTAFLENDMNRLLDAGLSVIPDECRLANAIRDVRIWCMEGGDWLEIRRKILEKWGSDNFTDAVMNLSFLVMSLLLGKGDFSRTICLAVNCGRDADCTAASAGAILGIINPDGISERWLKPIGRDIILNKGIVGITPPATLDEFTDMVSGLKDRVRFNGGKESSPFNPVKVKVECGVYHPWFAQDENRFAPKMPAQPELREFHANIGSIPYGCQEESQGDV